MNQTQDSPFVKTDSGSKKEGFLDKYKCKSIFCVIVIIILISILIYFIYTNWAPYSDDGFLQPQPRTDPQIDNNLDVEGEIALLNKKQESYFNSAA